MGSGFLGTKSFIKTAAPDVRRQATQSAEDVGKRVARDLGLQRAQAASLNNRINAINNIIKAQGGTPSAAQKKLLEELEIKQLLNIGVNPKVQKARDVERYMRERPDAASRSSLGIAAAAKDKDAVQEMLKRRGNLTGADYSKIDANKLRFGQNLKALGHDLKNQKYTPGAVLKRGWQNMGEGSGGWVAGNKGGRYVGAGGKSITGLFALSDLKKSVNRSDPDKQGASRTERLMSGAGGAVGSVVGSLGAARTARLGALSLPVSLVAGIGGMMGGYYLGGKAGKFTDEQLSKARGVAPGDYTAQLANNAGLVRLGAPTRVPSHGRPA